MVDEAAPGLLKGPEAGDGNQSSGLGFRNLVKPLPYPH